jgi:hypothetical protein
MITRLGRYGVLAALVVSGLLFGPAADAATRPAPKTWFGQVERHNGHFDYVGRPCAESEDVCADYIAHYRIVPTTRQAERALRRAAGHWARLWGEFTATREAGHTGTLRVSYVRRTRPPEPAVPARPRVRGTGSARGAAPV